MHAHMTAPTAPAPGYYADPLDPSAERWWDGSAWTETVRSAASAPGTEIPTVERDAALVEADGVPSVEPDPVPAAESVVVPLLEPDRAEQASAEQVHAQPTELAQPMGLPQPTDIAASAVPPGFYPDPYGQAPLRWWDGQQWTTQTSRPVSEQQVLPSPAAP